MGCSIRAKLKKQSLLFMSVLVMFTLISGCGKKDIDDPIDKEEPVVEKKEDTFQDYSNYTVELLGSNETITIKDHEFIETYGIVDEKLLFQIGDESVNETIYGTCGLYYFDLNTKEVVLIKEFDSTEGRVWSFTYNQDRLIYSFVSFAKPENSGMFRLDVVMEEDGKEYFIDYGYGYNPYTSPYFAIFNDEVYYLLISVDFKGTYKSITQEHGALRKIEGHSYTEIYAYDSPVSNLQMDRGEKKIIRGALSVSEKFLTFAVSEGEFTHLYYLTKDGLQYQTVDYTVEVVSAATDYIVMYYIYDVDKDGMAKRGFGVFNLETASIRQIKPYDEVISRPVSIKDNILIYLPSKGDYDRIDSRILQIGENSFNIQKLASEYGEKLDTRTFYQKNEKEIYCFATDNDVDFAILKYTLE